MTLSEVKQVVKAALKGQDFEAKELVAVLNIAKKVYYYGRYNESIGLSTKAFDWFETTLTDKVFDDLEDALRKKAPKSPYFKRNTGAPISNASQRKTKLPVNMPSLNKVKPDSKNLEKFIEKGPFVISAKIDGVSLLIQTKGKKLFTRGNGSVGQDISHLWNILNIPKNPKGDYTIRAEIVISKEVFEANREAFSKKDRIAKNARNSMSGLINGGEASSLFKHADILCYAVIGKKPSDAFPLLDSLGFNTPFWKVVKALDVDLLNKYLVKVKKQEHEADGLVVSKDVVEMPTLDNPINTMAFKNNDIADTKEFKVKEVKWEPSKHGLLKPVLSLVPQQLDGVTVGKCTAFNGKFVYDNNIGPWSTVKLVRSGGVIPHVLEVTKQASKPQMPEEYVWSGADVALPDIDNNDTVAIKKIAYFFRYMGAEGISKKFFQKMYQEGYETLKDILTLTKKQLMEIPGIQDKSASSIYSQIQKTKEATLADYMTASGCFPATIASTRVSLVLSKFPNILESKPKEMALHVASMPKFSTVTTKDFVSGALKFKSWMKDLKGILKIKAEVKAKAKSTKLKAIVVVPTGFRFSEELTTFLEENGATVQTRMDKNTTHVVAKDPNGSSSKIQKAKDSGVAVLSLEAFKKKIGA